LLRIFLFLNVELALVLRFDQLDMRVVLLVKLTQLDLVSLLFSSEPEISAGFLKTKLFLLEILYLLLECQLGVIGPLIDRWLSYKTRRGG
jgi:hypothetical protein